MKSIYLLLVFAVCFCFAQQQGNATNDSFGLESTFVNNIPLCSSLGEGNVTSGNLTTQPQVCTFEDEQLKCKTIYDQNNNRELVALVQGRGIAFYQGYPQSGNATLIAFYPSRCQDLFVIGVLGNQLLISSSEEVKQNVSGQQDNETGCEALGLGTIDLSELTSSGSSQLTPVQVQSNTQWFEYIDGYIWDPVNSTLFIKGASGVSQNETAGNVTSGDEKRDLILGFSGGDVNNPEILFQGKFPWNLDLSHSEIFYKEGSAYLVGPAWENTSSVPVEDDQENDQIPKSVEIWELGNLSDMSLVASLDAPGKFVGVGPDSDTLYIGALKEAQNFTGNVGTDRNDVLWIADISNIAAAELVSQITYTDIQAEAESNGVTFPGTNQTGNVTAPNEDIKNITAMNVTGDSLWIGWSNGVLVHFNLQLAQQPRLAGFIRVFNLDPESESDIPLPGEDEESRNNLGGVTDICPSKIRANRTWLTADDKSKEGALFLGMQLSSEQQTGGATGTGAGTGTGVGTGTGLPTDI